MEATVPCTNKLATSNLPATGWFTTPDDREMMLVIDGAVRARAVRGINSAGAWEYEVEGNARTRFDRYAVRNELVDDVIRKVLHCPTGPSTLREFVLYALVGLSEAGMTTIMSAHTYETTYWLTNLRTTASASRKKRLDSVKTLIYDFQTVLSAVADEVDPLLATMAHDALISPRYLSSLSVLADYASDMGYQILEESCRRLQEEVNKRTLLICTVPERILQKTPKTLQNGLDSSGGFPYYDSVGGVAVRTQTTQGRTDNG